MRLNRCHDDLSYSFVLCPFGNYHKIITHIILEIYVIHDVINSNLVLVVLTLYTVP